MKRTIYILAADHDRGLTAVGLVADVIYFTEHPFAIHKTPAFDADGGVYDTKDSTRRWTVTDCITGLAIGTAPSKRTAVTLLHSLGQHAIDLLRENCNCEGFIPDTGIYGWFMKTWNAYQLYPFIDDTPYKKLDHSKEYGLFIERLYK